MRVCSLNTRDKYTSVVQLLTHIKVTRLVLCNRLFDGFLFLFLFILYLVSSLRVLM